MDYVDSKRLKKLVFVRYEQLLTDPYLTIKSSNNMEKYGGTGDQDDLDNHSDQLNPNNDEYQGDDD